ncbi:MAG: hypothetical protein L0Y74_03565 [candidate division Zixibacteria bacterium]|nr:hypothetical protein [candidate division Zixibacteria bacterium]
MEKLRGQIQAVLSEKEISPDISLIELINQRIQPPVDVTADDVYIRAMYLVSDQVNSYGGRFPKEEQEQIARLVIDSPVLIGHNKEKLPVGRNFKAELVDKGNSVWVKVWFYWLKNSGNAESLKENIDHGIYKECSLGFSFELPECAICRQDIRKCQHIPFRTYLDGSGMETQAYFNYRKVVKVLETSIVYRGATPDTSFSADLEVFTKDKFSGQTAGLRPQKIEYQPAEVIIAELSQALQHLPASLPNAPAGELLLQELPPAGLPLTALHPEGIDLFHLKETLQRAKEMLISYCEEKRSFVQLQNEYADEIKRMAKAISVCKGNKGLSEIVERLISSGNLSQEDLQTLKKQVRDEFNQVFQSRPRGTMDASRESNIRNVTEFKIGMSTYPSPSLP